MVRFFDVADFRNKHISARSGLFMPLNCLLFFAGNGCGDYYGFPITLSDGVRDDIVFMWEHEYDNRIWKANNLEDTIRRYYNSETWLST